MSFKEKAAKHEEYTALLENRASELQEFLNKEIRALNASIQCWTESAFWHNKSSDCPSDDTHYSYKIIGFVERIGDYICEFEREVTNEDALQQIIAALHRN